MAGVHLYTSFTYAYLSRALVLARSVRRRHPDWIIWAVLVDAPPPDFADDLSWRSDFDHVLDPAILFGDEWRKWVFKHDVVEACTAVKGHALMHILESGADKVIYLDPDIAIFHDLSEIERRLDHASIMLTPHQIEPNATPEEIRDNELTSMKYGIFNLGFLAVKNDENGAAMARWWAGRLYKACYDDVPNGIFTDQKYCDHVPGLFAKVDVLRDPGYNVASWNLSRRSVSITRDGALMVNDKYPLRFYHFTKINAEGDIMTDRYARGRLAVFEIWNWYKRAIAAAELPGVPQRYWAYGQYEDGTPIKKEARVYFRTDADLCARFDDPFVSGEGGFQAYLRGRRDDLL